MDVRESEFRRKVSKDPEWQQRLEDFDLLHKDDWHQNFTQKWGNENTREIRGFRNWFKR